MVAFDTSWYRRVLIDRISKTISEDNLGRAYQEIAEFEEQLAADGAVIHKFWLHISREEQKKRFKKLLADNLTAWQVGEADKLQHKKYEKYYNAVEDMLARTDSPHAPWTIIEANDRYHARLKVLETMIQAIEFGLPDEALERSREKMKGAVDA
jgi:polyphosphate kinase 2 (PPK2 family)